MTAFDIQNAVGKMQTLKFHSPVIENFTPFWKWEYDVLSVSKSGMLCEFEVKISRADFMAQKEKTKMCAYSLPSINGKIQLLGGGITNIPNYFSYCCPTDIIREADIPGFAGLYYFENGEMWEMRAPKKIHKHAYDLERIKNKILRYYSERTYLGSCRLTYENKLNQLKYQIGDTLK